MLRILLSGCNGQMGKVITQLVSDNDNMEIVAGIDISGNAESAGFPIYDDPFKFDGEADVLIDFPIPHLCPVCDYCTDRKLPAILATTGYTDEQIALLRIFSLVPIFVQQTCQLAYVLYHSLPAR